MSKLIFFVDDDKMIINLLEYTFQNREQYDVKTFGSGKECIDALQMHPDLIVLDHKLSNDEAMLNGIEILQQIKDTNRELPVVVLTAFGNEDLENEYMEKGADRFLTKDDYFIDNLIGTIGEVLV